MPEVTDPNILAQLNGGQDMRPPAPQYPTPQQQPPPFIPGTPKPVAPTKPQDVWQVLSPEEAQTINLDPSKTWQRSNAGEIKIIGDAQPSNEESRANARDKLVRVIEKMDQIYADSADNNGWFETGVTGAAMRGTGISGTAAYDLGEDLKTLQASFAFDALQAMRDASKTGGALGQVSERELDLLQSSIANINPNQSQEAFIRNLGQAKSIYLERLRAIDPAAADEILQRGNPQTGADGIVTYDQRGREALGVTTQGDGPDITGPTEGPGVGDHLLQGTGNAIVGAAQGAGAAIYDFPMDVAGYAQKGLNYALTQGGGAALDAVGANQAADWWRRGGSQVQDDLNNPNSLVNLRVSDTLEQVAPTPEGLEAERFAAQLLGGAAVPFGPKAAPRIKAPQAPKAASSASDVIEQGADHGVRVMTTDVKPPKTFIGNVARATGERVPIAGTGGPRQAQQLERMEAIKNLAKEHGVDGTSDFLADVAEDFTKTRGEAVRGLTKRKDAVIDGVEGAMTSPKAVAEIDKQIARLNGINAEAFAPVISKLENFKQVLASGRSLREIEGNRKLLGDLFSDPSLASIKGEGQKAINAIYAPLRDDMGDFIRRVSGDDAHSQWAGANKKLAELMGELDSSTFKSVLSKTDTTPEDVSRLLFSKKPSEVRRLVANLSQEGQAKARAGILHLAVDAAGGLDNISPDKFAQAIARHGKAAGVVFGGKDLARLNGLERLLQATKRAGQANVAPPTGVQNSPFVGGAAAGMVLGGKAFAALGGAGGLARLYESAATRNLLVGLSKTQPGSKTEGRILERIMQAAAAQTEIQSGNIVRAANENPIVPSLAAQDDPRKAN